MAHYYAFCDKHKKFGIDRDTKPEAWADVREHQKTPGVHGEVIVKQSNKKLSKKGNTYYSYKLFLHE